MNPGCFFDVEKGDKNHDLWQNFVRNSLGKPIILYFDKK
jgi:hypothetical protein